MKLQEMRLLVRVAETGSMTRAARQMHLSPAAVSAAIRRIENEIGVRLFERTTRTLHPTDEGLVVIAGCQELVDGWQRTLEEVRGQRAELEGTIHLSAPADTASQVVGSVVVELCVAHPRLRVVLETSDAVHHLQRNAIDMAIRYGPLLDSTLTAHKLAATPCILVAAPSYAAAHGAPATPADLARHRCLTLKLSGVPMAAWPLRGPGTEHDVVIDSPLCGDGSMVRQWALEGVGIAFKSLFDVIDDLEQGRLVRVLPDHTMPPMPIHAVFPSRRFLPARIRALDTVITARFAARAARCAAWLGQG